MTDGDPNVEIPAESRYKLKRLSTETGLPMKEIIRRLIEDAWDPNTQAPAAKYERLLEDGENTVV